MRSQRRYFVIERRALRESYPHVASFRLDIAHGHERGSRNHYPYTKPKEYKHS